MPFSWFLWHIYSTPSLDGTPFRRRIYSFCHLSGMDGNENTTHHLVQKSKSKPQSYNYECSTLTPWPCTPRRVIWAKTVNPITSLLSWKTKVTLDIPPSFRKWHEMTWKVFSCYFSQSSDSKLGADSMNWTQRFNCSKCVLYKRNFKRYSSLWDDLDCLL